MSGEFFLSVKSRGIEPHVPLVKDPRDPKAVPHEKLVPGVKARRRMTPIDDRLRPRGRKKVEEDLGRVKLQQALELGAAAFNLFHLRTLAPAA